MKKNFELEDRKENYIKYNFKTGNTIMAPLIITEEQIRTSAELLAHELLKFADDYPGELITPLNFYRKMKITKSKKPKAQKKPRKVQIIKSTKEKSETNEEKEINDINE